MKTLHRLPPRNAQRIYRVADLPKDCRPAQFRITREDGESRLISLKKRCRQIAELLMRGPVYCASPVRISDIVCILKHKFGLDVETLYFPGDKQTGAGDYGVYFLRSHVARLESEGAA